MKLKLERSNGVGLGIGMYPPNDMTGWAREFFVWFGTYCIILKVW